MIKTIKYSLHINDIKKSSVLRKDQNIKIIRSHK